MTINPVNMGGNMTINTGKNMTKDLINKGENMTISKGKNMTKIQHIYDLQFFTQLDL